MVPDLGPMDQRADPSSRRRPVGNGKSALLFTPRRPDSTWSQLNKQRVGSLTA